MAKGRKQQKQGVHERVNSYYDFKHEDYNLISYVQGDKMYKNKNLGLEHFDEVLKMKFSECEKTKQMFLHCVGYRNGEPYLLILQEKNEKIN